jgi:hypothetical protein
VGQAHHKQTDTDSTITGANRGAPTVGGDDHNRGREAGLAAIPAGVVVGPVLRLERCTRRGHRTSGVASAVSASTRSRWIAFTHVACQDGVRRPLGPRSTSSTLATASPPEGLMRAAEHT